MKLSLFTLFTLFCAFLTFSTSAQEPEQKRQGLLVNGKVSAARDNNVLRNNTELSDSLLKVSPIIGYLNENANRQYFLSYEGEYAKFNKLSSYDYTDHTFTAGANLRHRGRLSSQFDFQYFDGIETPSAWNSITLSDEFNKTSRAYFRAKVRYGTNNSQGQFVLGLDASRSRFDNNEQFFRDIDSQRFYISFYYKLASRTRLFLETGLSNYDYKNVLLEYDQSSKQTEYYLGLEWRLSEQLVNVVKVGYLNKEYEQTQFNDISGLSYSLDMTWSPHNRTDIVFGASRTTSESAILGTRGYLSSEYSVGINHDISSVFSLKAEVRKTDDEFNSRDDDRTNYRIAASYNKIHWLDISVEYIREDRQSTDASFDFDLELIQLTFSSTFE